ncbi:MAG: hypothetical protein E7358_03215 [Clostridiales bacterium]|nr:hypothetical protein [Clostridiales bacterium]
MDKFFYRFFVQTLFKGVLILVLSCLATILISCILDIVLHNILFIGYSADFDFWMYAISFFITGGLLTIILVPSDNVNALNYSADKIGKYWANLIKKGKKINWFWLRLLILPLLLIAIYCGYVVIADGSKILSAFRDFYAQAYTGQLSDALSNNILYFLYIVLAVYFFAKWLHLRAFCKKGTCSHCKSAFSLVSTSLDSWDKSESVSFSTEDYKEEVGAVRVGDGKWMPIYDNYEVQYKINTEKTTRTSHYICAHCKKEQERKYSYVSKQTKTPT